MINLIQHESELVASSQPLIYQKSLNDHLLQTKQGVVGVKHTINGIAKRKRWNRKSRITSKDLEPSKD
jgi:hypothetical protein